MTKVETTINTSISGSVISLAITSVCTPPGFVPGRSPIEDMVRSFATRVIDTEEASIKEALVKMGWTPPPGLTPA